MVYKFLKKVSVLYLVTVIAMLQMVCLPESSKEIEDARNADNKKKELKIKLEEKRSNCINNLKQTKDVSENIKRGLDVQLDEETKNKRITGICIEFLKAYYIPYLQVKKEYFAHMAKYEEDILERKEYKDGLEHHKAYIRSVEILLQKKNSYNGLDNNKVYEFVKGLS
jgi:hypothetical protein